MKCSCIPTLLRKPHLFHRVTTVSLEEFHTLTDKLESEWMEREIRRLSSRTRINTIGQGRHYEIGEFPNLVLCTLLYLRTSIGYELLGLLCGVDKTTVRRVVTRTLPLLQDRFMPDTPLNPKKRRTNNLDDLLKEFPELKDVIFDGTELPIKRPKRYQKRSYSGKKKRHTKKVQLALDKKTMLVVGISPPRRGRMHDKRQVETTGWNERLSPSVLRWGDLGYQGMAGWRIPHKKPRGGTLTLSQKRYNKRLAKERIVVEHGIRRMKVFRRIGETVTAKTDDLLFTTLRAAANLSNFKWLLRHGLG